MIEETGYRAKRWTLLTKYFASPGFLGEWMQIYLARDIRDGVSQPEDDEQIEVFRLPSPKPSPSSPPTRSTTAKPSSASCSTTPPAAPAASNSSSPPRVKSNSAQTSASRSRYARLLLLLLPCLHLFLQNFAHPTLP